MTQEAVHFNLRPETVKCYCIVNRNVGNAKRMQVNKCAAALTFNSFLSFFLALRNLIPSFVAYYIHFCLFL